MRILIVDDHPIIHQAAAEVLKDLAGETPMSAYSAQEGFAEFKTRRPDISIIDDTLPGASGFELIGDILGLCPEACLVMFASDGGAISACRALDLGSKGFVGKSDPPDLLAEAVRKTSCGEIWMPERLKQEIAFLRLKGGDADYVSSARELSILSKLSRGSSLGEISYDLGLSYKTVTNEVAALRRKLKARTQPEMIRIAIEKGLLG